MILFRLLSRWPGHLAESAYRFLDEAREAPAEEEDEPFVGPLESIPANRREVYKVYGDPGIGKPDKKFQRENLIIAKDLPGQWNGGKARLYCHRLAEPYIREALRRAEAVAPGYIQRLGCYNFRHQRHDSSRPLSYHSWAMALDINPADNFSRDRKKYGVPAPFAPGWADIWPKGIPEAVAQVFRDVGWTWGGDWKNFVDPMHMQLAG